MDKYDIEGGIDFFSELYKSLDETTDDDAPNDSSVFAFMGFFTLFDL